LWLVRHGRTAGNDEGRIQGRSDFPLNEQGLQEASLLAERMAGISVAALYSSPLLRARQTASVIGQRVGLPVNVLDELSEIDMGSWERRTFRATDGADDGLGLGGRWVFGPDRPFLGGRETLEELVDRGRLAVETIGKQQATGDVCVAAHAGIILGVISACLALSDGTFLPSFMIGNASISLLEHRLGRWLLAFSNDQRHLGADWRPADDLLMTLFGRPDGLEPMRTQR